MKRGASGGTYALLVGLISVVALTAVTSSGDSINELFAETSDTLGTVITSSSAAVQPASSPAASASPSASPSPSAPPLRASCKAILDAGESTGDGTYSIDPDGAGPLGQITVECNMDDGGRTMLARTQTWGAQGSRYVIFTDMVTAMLGNTTAWDMACSHHGKTRYTGSYEESGRSYADSSLGHYTAARSFTNDVIMTYVSSTVESDLLVLHSHQTNCWAHENEANAMQAFDPSGGSGSIYSYCRNGDQANKRYHIYICNP
ncbi:MAG: hypothetical protein Alpg2KO_12000 [Alphaproteobacteria bacterium]